MDGVRKENGSRLPGIPKCTGMRTRPGRIEPEVYFRVVHLAQISQGSAPLAPFSDQMVEIALGPKGAFENGNIGVLRRQAPPDQVLSAAPPARGEPKPPPEPKTPRVVELLRKAIEWQTLLETGKVTSQTEIAQLEGISPIATITDHHDQVREFHKLLGSQLTQIRDVP